MHLNALDRWRHSHDFLIQNEPGERRTLYVLILTAVTMIAEILAGSVFGSMALMADGWHMATHVAAFLITLFAYRYARKHANNPAYAFGTGKVTVLGGFASSITLLCVALVMLIESTQRIFDPHDIQFDEAIIVAGIGLTVNLLCAFLLKDNHTHGDQQDHPRHDHNMRAAYFHVLADALTSVLAITALVSGKYLGWNWLDPIMGIVGAIIISRWSWGLLKQTSPILLDAGIGTEYQSGITAAIENDSDDRVTDIHVWKVSEHHYAAIISLVSHDPKTADFYKGLLNGFGQLSHITIEVNACTDEP
jgi:cation diffusion facilitator family transporter